MIKWEYRSYQQIIHDCHMWCDNLPPVSAVVGIPRSGVLIASLIAQRRAIPLLSIEALLYSTHPRTTKYNRPRSVVGPTLVVDDTCWTGDSIALHRAQLSGRDVIFGALYAHEPHGKVDTWGVELHNEFHTFEYNFMRQGFTDRYVVDIDVIRKQDNAPTWLLPTFHVHTVVLDNPLQRRWLRTHHVSCGRLAYGNTLPDKIRAYQADPSTTLFVESRDATASGLYRVTGRPVFSVESMSLYQS